MSAARIAELEAQVSRLERALDKRLDPEHVRVAQSFTGCSEDRCPRAAQEAIAALILHAQAWKATAEVACARGHRESGLLPAAAMAANWMVDRAQMDLASGVAPDVAMAEAFSALWNALAEAAKGGAP